MLRARCNTNTAGDALMRERRPRTGRTCWSCDVERNRVVIGTYRLGNAM